MALQEFFEDTEVRYKDLLDHIKKGGTVEEFALQHSNVSQSRLEAYLAIGTRLREFDARMDEIKNAQKNLPVRQGKRNCDDQLEIVLNLSSELISEMESFRYSIQFTEFFHNASKWIDNRLVGVRKVNRNPFDRWTL